MNNFNLKLLGFESYFRDLSQIYLNKNLPNKLIFSGRRGIGKLLLTNHFINYIFSMNEQFAYNLDMNIINDKNKSFILLKNNSHPNFHKICKEKDKKYIEISQIRNLYNFVNKSSFNDELKIILIEDIENLSVASSNGLLKLIEEPNKNVHYFLTHNSSKSILDTIKSRCITYRLNLDNKYKTEIINQYFDENIFDELSEEFKDPFLTPGDVISLIELIKILDVEITNLTLEEILQKIIEKNVYRNKNISVDNIKILIEMLFIKKYRLSKNENFLKLTYYFNKKFSDIINFNLDLEIFFLEFKSRVLNGK